MLMLKNKIGIMSRETAERLILDGFPDNAAVISFLTQDPRGHRRTANRSIIPMCAAACSRSQSTISTLKSFRIMVSLLRRISPKQMSWPALLSKKFQRVMTSSVSANTVKAEAPPVPPPSKNIMREAELRFSRTIGIIRTSSFSTNCLTH